MTTANPTPRDVRGEIGALLSEADAQIAVVETLYRDSLENKQIPLVLQTKIKGALENQRSALEYIAHEITDRYGGTARRIYFPYAPTQPDFATRMEQNMPGVAVNRADIADAIEECQPYMTSPPWLAYLVPLTNENKHNRLSPQTRDETRWIDTRVGAGHSGVVFQPYQPGKGGVSFAGQVFINGTEVDPTTLQPRHGGPKPYIETIYVDWLFSDLNLSAIVTLKDIQRGVRSAVESICHIAGL